MLTEHMAGSSAILIFNRSAQPACSCPLPAPAPAPAPLARLQRALLGIELMALEISDLRALPATSGRQDATPLFSMLKTQAAVSHNAPPN